MSRSIEYSMHDLQTLMAFIKMALPDAEILFKLNPNAQTSCCFQTWIVHTPIEGIPLDYTMILLLTPQQLGVFNSFNSETFKISLGEITNVDEPASTWGDLFTVIVHVMQAAKVTCLFANKALAHRFKDVLKAAIKTYRTLN